MTNAQSHPRQNIMHWKCCWNGEEDVRDRFSTKGYILHWFSTFSMCTEPDLQPPTHRYCELKKSVFRASDHLLSPCPGYLYFKTSGMPYYCCLNSDNLPIDVVVRLLHLLVAFSMMQCPWILGFRPPGHVSTTSGWIWGKQFAKNPRTYQDFYICTGFL